MSSKAIPPAHKFTTLLLLAALAAWSGLAAAPSTRLASPASKPTTTRPTTGPDAVVLPKEMDVPEITVPPSPVLPPAEAMKTIKVAPGFKLELVAAEPLVEDPIAIAFGPDGKLWVCEMRAYMPHLDPGPEEEKPTGQISYLEDTDGDGVMDRKTVFLDGLVLPRAVSPYRDGVLVAAPPNVWFCRDTDGDGKCDERQLLATDFTNHSNPEHQPNGLMPSLDNWVHNAQWPGKFLYVGDHPDDPTSAALKNPRKEAKSPDLDPRWVRAAEPARGQWGISQDDVGRLYTNGNSDMLRGDYLPAALVTRSPDFVTQAGSNGINQKVSDDQSVHPARPTPGVNRGYQPGSLDAQGRLRTVTAACSPHIFRGDGLGTDPQGRPLQGNAFVCEPSANLVHRMILTETDGLIVKATAAYKDSEFLASTDERFRPVFLADGPDGALYVCDLYRGVLQHQRYVTPYLRREIKRRDLEEGIHLGRIYRVVPAGGMKTPAAKPNLLKARATEMVQVLSHPAGWWRDMAQQQIVARNDPSVVPALRELATASKAPLGRLQALYTLEGLRKLDENTLAAAVAGADARVRVAALRLAEPFVADAKSPLVPAVLKASNDEHPEVRLSFLFTASTIDAPEARRAVMATYAADYKRPYTLIGVLSGLRGRELEFAEHLMADPDWAAESPAGRALLGGLAGCVVREHKPERVAKLLDLAAAQPESTAWRGSAILDGIAAIAADKGRAPSPVKLDAEPTLLAHLESAADGKTKALAKSLDSLFTWPGKASAAVKVAPLTKEEQASFDRGKQIFLGTCAACHQPDGQGEVGKAPSFRNSPLLLGPEGRPIRIVLHGLRGKVTINGETSDLEMPTLAALNDEQIADALTYVRREWGHTAAPVKPTSVAKLREELKDRGQPWTRDELTAMKSPGAK